MKILIHHIYEYKKGLRNLVLCTLNIEYLDEAIGRLERNNIVYFVQKVTDTKVNIFFGLEECIAIIQGFANKSLNTFTDEEDFILGIMLGYCPVKQCRRYLKRKSRSTQAATFQQLCPAVARTRQDTERQTLLAECMDNFSI